MNHQTGRRSILDLPEACRAGFYEPTLNISQLPRETKRAVWADLTRNNPKTSAAIQTLAMDPVVKELIEMFDASFALSKNELSEAAYAELAELFK